MDTSQNKDIAIRQSLLGVAGLNAIPPQHIVKQQRLLSQTEFASTRKIIALEHREICPLCHCPSFIFLQLKYINKITSSNINGIGTFMCKKCININIKYKLSEINILKKEINELSNIIKPILIKKLNHKYYYDNKLKSKQYLETISNLRKLILEKQNNNKILLNKCILLKTENNKRKNKLNIMKSKYYLQWENIYNEYKNKYKINKTQLIINSNICKQISLNKLLQITNFYNIKVLPMMNNKQLSMISNIAIPSIFKIKYIKSFYNNCENKLFRFPLQNKQLPYYNKSSSSLQKYDLILPPTSSRNRSQSLDALQTINKIKNNKQLQHLPHIEHGICAALQYIVSYILHIRKYLNIILLYKMGLYKKNKKGKFIIHTYIQRKGKYFRLYYINNKNKNNNNQEFEVGLHLLQENINNLCNYCGIKSSKLKYLNFIDNLNILINHLKNNNNNNNNKKIIIKKPKIEPLNIINNYGSPKASISHSFSESTTAINNSESDVVIPPHEADSEHEDWDFVDYN